MDKRPALPQWPFRSPTPSWVSAVTIEAAIAFSGGLLLTIVSERWPDDAFVSSNAVGWSVTAVAGLAIIVGVPVIVTAFSPASDALGIATRSGLMLALLFALAVTGVLFPYWRGWFELEDQDIRDVYPLIPSAAVAGFALGFLGGFLLAAGRYIVRLRRRP